jgi:hypothetical protein
MAGSGELGGRDHGDGGGDRGQDDDDPEIVEAHGSALCRSG